MARKGLLAIAAFASMAIAAVNPQLASVHTIYILPMAGGMDQFLASRLTARGVVQVVADPKHADAVLTDHIGESFETRMNDLYAPPTEKSKDAASQAGFTAPPPPIGTFGRGRGSFFLVDRKTRSVVWSVYERPHGTRPDDLNHTATKIAGDLEGDLVKAGKAKK